VNDEKLVNTKWRGTTMQVPWKSPPKYKREYNIYQLHQSITTFIPLWRSTFAKACHAKSIIRNKL